MALIHADWTIDRSNGNIRYIGDDHDGSPTYATVIQFHRWLQDLADDQIATASNSDELDITNTNPSARSTDNIITLVNSYNIDSNASEHLFDGSIIQDGGDTIYDGIVNFGNASVQIQIHQNGAVLADDWWNFSDAGLNPNATSGISHRFMLLVRENGVDIDNRKIFGICRTYENTYAEFKINATARGNNVLALADSDDLNNETVEATVAGWTGITNTEGLRDIDVNNDGSTEEYYSEWNRDVYTINQLFERTKWISKSPTAIIGTDTGTDFAIDDTTIGGQAQSFTVDANAKVVKKVVFPLKKETVATTGLLTVTIYDDLTGPNAPVGTASATYDATLLTTTEYRQITFNFPVPVPVTASTEYWAVIEHDTGHAVDFVTVDGLTTGASGTGNRAEESTGWNEQPADDDLAYEVYMEAIQHSMPGSLFRGITHSFTWGTEGGTPTPATNNFLAWGTNLVFTGGSGTFLVGEEIKHNNATPNWVGRILAVDDDTGSGSIVVSVEGLDEMTGAETFVTTSGGAGTVSGTPTVVTGGGYMVVLAVDDNGTTGDFYVQLMKGTAPDNTDIVYECGTDPSAITITDYYNQSTVSTERTIETPFQGASTGSAIIGAYGFGVEYNDLQSADKVTNLAGGAPLSPPNLVTNIVSGMVSTEDYLIIAPWTDGEYDTEGNPAFNKNQLELGETLTGGAVATIDIRTGTSDEGTPIPPDTPADGTIRVVNDDGLERLIPYTSWDTDTFTLDGTHDFSGGQGTQTYQATIGNNLYVTYLDNLYDGTTDTDRFVGIKPSGSRDLVVVVRDGGGAPKNSTPIKEFIKSWTLTDTGQSLGVTRTTDA